MNYVILFLLVVIVILLVLLFIKANSNKTDLNVELIEKLGKFELSIHKNNAELINNVENQMNENFYKLNSSLNDQIFQISKTMDNKISDNFRKTNETFNSVVERLGKIDQAQKKIDELSTDIVSLQSILSDKTARGSFGEVQLKNILISVFGETSPIYSMQYTMSNNTRVDAVLFAPEPLNMVGIDSKFPLDNYRRAIDPDNNDNKSSITQFKNDLKKHIDDIASKYIIASETTQAIMFLPAEAVFAYMQTYCMDVVEYANRKKVWITSPTTLVATLTTLQIVMQNIERDKHTKVIQVELEKLGVEFDRYVNRFEKLIRSVNAVNKDISDITVTSNKITKRFSQITNVELDEIGENDD